MANYKKSPDRERLDRLKNSFGEQAKELAVPVLTDLVSIAGGWFAGRMIGRPSLLLGLVTYGAGKVHSLHETINREQKRLGKTDEETAPVLSGLNPLYKSEDRFYMGDSPLVPLGIGMMIGGAMGSGDGLGAIDQSLNAADKAKSTFTQLKEDLSYRLYLDKFFTPKTEKNNLPAPATVPATVPGTAAPAVEQKPVSGLGEIDVFVAGDAFNDEPEMKHLSRFEDQIKFSARDFDMQKREMSTPAVSTAQLSATPQMQTEEDDLEAFSGGRIL